MGQSTWGLKSNTVGFINSFSCKLIKNESS